jgi:hypothetical protein
MTHLCCARYIPSQSIAESRPVVQEDWLIDGGSFVKDCSIPQSKDEFAIQWMISAPLLHREDYMKANQYRALVLVVVAVSAVGGAMYLSLHPVETLRNEGEWVKALIQVGLIAVLGVVTTGVLESYKDGLQRAREQSKIRFAILADVGRIYMDVKLVRRQAQGIGSIQQNDSSTLNKRQVRLELHKHNSASFFRGGAALGGILERMEKYLNRVANEPASNERQGFLSDGFKAFSRDFRDALAIMQRDIAD